MSLFMRTAMLSLLLAAATAHAYAVDIALPGPDSLSQVIGKAIENSDELAVAREKIEQTKATLGEAHASYMPQVAITHKAGRNAANPSSARSAGDLRGTSEYANTSSSKFEVNQMLFDGFRTPAEIKRQRQLLKGLQQRYRTVSQEVVRNTLSAYLAAWRNMQALKAGVTLLEDMEEINRKVALQASLGAADQASKSFAEARLTGARQELLKNKNAYRDALYRLSYLVRNPLQPGHFAMGQLQAPVLGERDAYIAGMQNANPQVLEETANEAAAKADVRKARAGLYPTLLLTSDLEDNNDVGGTSGNSRIGNVMVQASYKLFDGFATHYQRQRVASQLSEARIRRQRTMRQLEEDISQLWRQTTATQQEFNLAMEEVSASRKVLDVRQQDVDNGTGDIVRLIEAQENNYAAVLRLIDLAQAIASKRFELALSAGQLEDFSCLSTACGNMQLAAVFPPSAPISTTTTLSVSATAFLNGTGEPVAQVSQTQPVAAVSATQPLAAVSASAIKPVANTSATHITPANKPLAQTPVSASTLAAAISATQPLQVKTTPVSHPVSTTAVTTASLNNIEPAAGPQSAQPTQAPAPRPSTVGKTATVTRGVPYNPVFAPFTAGLQ
jgi:adhesin transport system outer membrane protein